MPFILHSLLFAALALLPLSCRGAVRERDGLPAAEKVRQWTGEAPPIVGFAGFITPAGGDRLAIRGTLDGRRILLSIGPRPASSILFDGSNITMIEAETGLHITADLSGMAAPLVEEADLFGLLPPLGGVSDESRDLSGNPILSYPVEDGVIYNAVFSDSPIRLLVRQVVRNGRVASIFHYSDFVPLIGSRLLPLTITIHDPDDRPLVTLNLTSVFRGDPKVLEETVDEESLIEFSGSASEILASDEFLIAAAALRSGRGLEEAAGRLEALDVRLGPNDLITYYRARVAFEAGDLDGADEFLSRLDAFDEARSSLELDIARERFVDEGDSSYLDRLVTAWMRSDSVPERLVSRAAVLWGRILIDESGETATLEWVDAKRREMPANGDLALLSSRLALALGDTVRAGEVLHEWMAAETSSIRPILACGEYHESMDEPAIAADLYSEALERIGPSVPLYLAGIKARLAAGETAAAAIYVSELVSWSSGLGLSPKPLADIKNEAAFFLADGGGDLDLARGLVTEALLVSPSDPDYIDTLGYIVLRRNDPSTALVILARSEEIRSDPRVELHIAEALDLLGRSDEADRYRAEAERHYLAGDGE